MRSDSRSKRNVVAAAFALATLAPRSSSAADRRPSYAAETLAVDGAALAMMVMGVATSHELEAWPRLALVSRPFEKERHRGPVWPVDVGVLLYTAGTPILHALHGQGLPVLASLGMRLVAPSVGLLFGGFFGGTAALAVGDCELSKGCRNDTAADVTLYGGISLGLLAGFAAPVLVDAFVLAREPAASSTSTRVTPRFAAIPGGAFAGLGGSF